MRELIKFAAGVFVVLGGVVFAICAVMTLGVLGQSGGAEAAGFAATIVAFGGLISGASIILIGGAAYLLASIDERLEGALQKPGLAPSRRGRSGSSSADELAAAQVG